MELTRVEGKWLISDIDPTGVGAEVAEGIEKAERSQQTAKDLDCSTFRFDADEWRRAANDSVETPTRRQRLADALLKCRTLIGKGENELTELLGRPDDYVAAKDQRSWVTGTERSYFAIDNEHLVAEFDRSGEVGSVELATD